MSWRKGPPLFSLPTTYDMARKPTKQIIGKVRVLDTLPGVQNGKRVCLSFDPATLEPSLRLAPRTGEWELDSSGMPPAAVAGWASIELRYIEPISLHDLRIFIREAIAALSADDYATLPLSVRGAQEQAFTLKPVNLQDQQVVCCHCIDAGDAGRIGRQLALRTLRNGEEYAARLRKRQDCGKQDHLCRSHLALTSLGYPSNASLPYPGRTALRRSSIPRLGLASRHG